MFQDIRKSFSGTKEDKGVPAWAEKYDFSHDPHQRPHPQRPLERVETTLPPVPPLPIRTPHEALSGDERAISTRSPSPYAQHVLPPSFAITPAEPPRLNLPETGGSRIDWSRYSPPVSAEMLQSPDEEDWQSTRSSSNIHGTSQPLESYYSIYSTPSYYPGPHDAMDTIGQAISAPGRESIEASAFPLPPGSIRFPQPAGPSIEIRPSSNARNLVPSPMAPPDNLALPVALHYGRIGDRASASGNSSLFEYSDYDPRHSANRLSHHTNTTRATQNWYDKPLWDANQPESVYGGMSEISRSNTRATARTGVGRTISGVSEASGVWTTGEEGDKEGRKSRSKSVRWGDEEPLPPVSSIARAL